MNIYRKIYSKIKKYNKIVIVRHIGPDPDALGSSIGLKEAILNTFPKKEVYAVGIPAAKHKYLGEVDTFNESMYENSLLIVVDTPDIKRVDGVDPLRFEYKIKIDHHPLVDKYCDIELIDDTASSASQLIINLLFKTPLKLNKSVAEKLYAGVVSDTNRFLYAYTSSSTFSLVAKMIKETSIDITKVYENMYLRSIDDKKLESYAILNMKITDNGLGYLFITQEDLNDLKTDAATMANMVNFMQYTKEMIAWVICAYDNSMGCIRSSIRSRGPIINEVASHFNGGGHVFASGARPKDFEEAKKMIEELDLVCKEYGEE